MTTSNLAEAVRLLQAGELVAFPTETVYGLGAHALDPVAVAKIYAAKGRPSTSPLIVHVATGKAARALTRHWPPAADLLAAHFWPGPLTLVLPKAPCVPDIVTAGLDSVGIRIPRHPLALALLQQAGIPLAAPSANRFTELSPTRAAHVLTSLGDRVALILDGGPTDVGIESTVLSLTRPEPVLLRPGMIDREQLEAVIGPVRLHDRSVTEAAQPSPGLHDRHYRPRTALFLTVPPTGRGVWLSFSTPPPRAAKTIPMPMNPSEYALHLYDTLHTLDEQQWDWIAVEMPPDTPAWQGIRDRLQRAAHQNSPT